VQKRGRGYRFGEGASWAAGWFSYWAERVPRGPNSYFSFSSSFLFLFLVYFISFSKLVQIDSNQFVKFSKIPSHIPEQ
jgi:hypothetical protein